MSAVGRSEIAGAPPRLSAAIRHAVFPGGARVRPHLCLAVAGACGDDSPYLSDAAAAAIELLHCASLAHDDLPCFDDAGTRRGRPSTHIQFGQPLAVLAGDALIVMAFEALGAAGARAPERLAPLIATVAQGVGAPHGIVAGQAWESEPFTPLDAYHRAKTGALFVTATTAGALSAGVDPQPWVRLGDMLGAAFQIADDLIDSLCEPEECGKPTGADALLRRPSAVAEMGVKGALAHLEGLVAGAIDAIPECDGAERLRDIVWMQAKRLTPKQLARAAVA